MQLRNTWLCTVTALALVSSAALPQVTLKPIESDPVRIDSGLVSGTYLQSGVKAYFGIPFAAPPVRELRWRAPQPVKTWQGVYTANRMLPECPQNLRSSDINHYFGEEALSEDCLYLNIWVPATARANAKLPVVAWIYGGGFTGGSSGMTGTGLRSSLSPSCDCNAAKRSGIGSRASGIWAGAGSGSRFA